MRYLMLCCLLPVLSLCAVELTQEQQDEKAYQAYQEQVRIEQLAAMEAKQSADEISQVEEDVQTLNADYPALTPDAALTKLRDDFRKEADPKAKWAKYEKLRAIESRVKAIQARNANGEIVPAIPVAISAEKAKLAAKAVVVESVKAGTK